MIYLAVKKKIRNMARKLEVYESKIKENHMTQTNKHTKRVLYTTRFGDITKLPEELKKQIPELRYIENHKVVKALKALEGIGTLSEVIIQIYEQTGEIIKREECMKQIYILVRQGIVERVKKHKGVYQLINFYKK